MPKLSAIFEAPPHAPSVDEGVQQALLEMTPRTFLRWSRRSHCWEIWCELRDSSHPDAANARARGDRWNTDAQMWMRKLQLYRTADGEFAPADWRLVQGLEMADAWANRRFYEEHIEEAYDTQEMQRMAQNRQMFRDAGRYYHGIPNPIVAPRGGHGGKADWRQGSML